MEIKTLCSLLGPNGYAGSNKVITPPSVLISVFVQPLFVHFNVSYKIFLFLGASNE